ncbi:MAG: hypothetical protein ABFD84_11425 [Candidatus Polarisedimenticolia bacterium]
MTTPRYALLAAGQIHERHRAARRAAKLHRLVRAAVEDRGIDAVIAAWEALDEKTRDAVDYAATLVTRRTAAVGGHGQNVEQRRHAAEAVAALPRDVRRLAAAAVPAWCSALSELWLWGVEMDGLARDCDSVYAFAGDDAGVWALEKLVLVSGRWDAVQLAFSMQYAISCGYEKRPRRG